MGEPKHDGLAIPGEVVLAHESPFTLGNLRVAPATLQVVAEGRSRTVQPRIMRVLVALAAARGQIVTRDELVERCWGRRIVGDDAINRAMTRIREIANGLGDRSFRIETIPKVGYRLVSGDAPRQAPPVFEQAAPIARRPLLIGGLASAGVAAAGVGYWVSNRSSHEPSAAALALYRKGMESRDSGLPGSRVQAESYFLQAVETDPDFADAWGALGLHQAMDLGFADDGSLDAIAQRSQASAARALALDRNQIDARAALALIPNPFRNWGSSERAIRGVLRDKLDHGILVNVLSMLFGDTGQWDRSVEAARKALQLRPLVMFPVMTLIYGLWSAGRVVEAESESTAALRRWPRNANIWFARMELLVYSGRPDAAITFAANKEHLPPGLEADKEPALAEARALITGDPHDIARARAMLLEQVAQNIHAAHPAVRFLATVGAHDDAFDLLDAYLLHRGPFAANLRKPMHPLARVATYSLFDPPAQALWHDPRFAALTREVGLDAYWHSIDFTPPHLRS